MTTVGFTKSPNTFVVDLKTSKGNQVFTFLDEKIGFNDKCVFFRTRLNKELDVL